MLSAELDYFSYRCKNKVAASVAWWVVAHVRCQGSNCCGREEGRKSSSASDENKYKLACSLCGVELIVSYLKL